MVKALGGRGARRRNIAPNTGPARAGLGVNPFPTPENGRASVHALVASPAPVRASGPSFYSQGPRPWPGVKVCQFDFLRCQPTFLCQGWLKALAQDACPSGEGDLNMLAALRGAGSSLPKHVRRCLRELQRRRRCLPAEPDLPAPTLGMLTDVVHTEPAGHLHAWPDGQEGAVMTRGQSPAVTVAYSTRQ